MKNFRWMVAGFAMGALFALGPSCSPKPVCNAGNCPGCCDTANRCQLGSVDNSCGKAGGACTACQQNQACQTGICTLVYNPQCSQTSCPSGCCASGGCNAGNTRTSCGTNGTSCAVCGVTQDCVNGLCVGGEVDGGTDGGTDGGSDGGACGPGNCAGCCQSGVCVPITSQTNTQCGTLGGACVDCGSGNTCNAGSCNGTSACSASSCPAGCCYGTGASAQCLAGTSNTYCGNYGATCATCSGVQSCVNKTCSGSTACNPTNCSTGCCSGGVCLPGNTDTNCGGLGGNCQICNTAGGQSCTSQTCTGGSTGGVGNPCSFASDCTGLTNAVCKLKTGLAGIGTYTDGYCTRNCTSNTDCGADGLCLTFGPADDEPTGKFCTKICPTPYEQSTCRTGYWCYGLTGGSTDGICWIYPPPVVDAGPPSDKVGVACTTDQGCQSPPDDGICFQGTLTDGGPSGWTSGYCTAPCDTSPDHCGAGGSCFNLTSGTSTFAACLALCYGPGTGQGGCRSGYICDGYGLADGGSSQDGICWPNCNNPGRSCGTGVCGASGYCQ